MSFFLTKPKRLGLTEHFPLVILLAFLASIFVQYNLLWRWDNLLYDAHLSLWSRTVSDDIIIVAIDDESLNQLGRWPWPRSVHAQLINELELSSPRVIGLDIIFNELDKNNPLADQQLATAIKTSGKVVLPLFMSQKSINSHPFESLPAPIFSDHAKAFGHVHLDVSEDGIARKVYLKEGIGKPQWLHYSLAILNVNNPDLYERQLQKSAPSKQYSSMLWSKESPFLIPYAGPSGHFKHIGYSQVLSGNYQKDLFRNKIVLIGATAMGMGDAYPTPLSSKGGSMSGVEIIANIIDSLQKNLHINELNKNWLIVISAILVALPLLIYPYLNPGSTLLVLFGIVVATVSVIALLLLFFGLWIPLSTVILFQFISYPLWSWRRLKFTMHHINSELDKLTERLGDLTILNTRNIKDELSFISRVIPIVGWELQDEQGKKLVSHGVLPLNNQIKLKKKGWNNNEGVHWAYIDIRNKHFRLGIKLKGGKAINDDEIQILNNLIDIPQIPDSNTTLFTEDILQVKIKQVQRVGNEYEELRNIIDGSLTCMADGILVCSSQGKIILSNKRAGWYIYGDDNAIMNAQTFNHIFESIPLRHGVSWGSILRKVLNEQQRTVAYSKHKSGHDLMIEISPLDVKGSTFGGFVVNFSDISLLRASERKRNKLLDFLYHDLRSPLSSMLALIELSKNKSSLNEVQPLLDSMQKNTTKTLHLADQFLQLSRANTSENIKFYDVDFNSLVINAIDQIWALSNKNNITIKPNFNQEECWIYAEADLLERAILNLLSNAIKHSDSGSTIDIIVTQAINEISCCVIDNGVGISTDKLPYLFDMFQRIHGDGLDYNRGIGLGLAFVNAVAKRHSGNISVESEVGIGSKFCLNIPKSKTIEKKLEIPLK